MCEDDEAALEWMVTRKCVPRKQGRGKSLACTRATRRVFNSMPSGEVKWMKTVSCELDGKHQNE